MSVNKRLEAFERRIQDLIKYHQVEGVVPRLRSMKREDESWRSFKQRIGTSVGFAHLRRWCQQGEMPSWWVDTVRAEIGNEDVIPKPSRPMKLKPTRISSEKQRIRKEG